MFYLVLRWLCWPVLRLIRVFQPIPNNSNVLVIQTAKIGDWVNTTPVLRHLQKCDVIIDSMNLPLAQNSRHVEYIWCLQTYRKGWKNRFKLLWQLFSRRYTTIYVLMPNNLNLWLASLAMPKQRFTLSTYNNGSTAKKLMKGFSTQYHGKQMLALHSYLRLIGAPINQDTEPKYVTDPVVSPTEPLSVAQGHFNVGISLTAGNALKTIPMETWQQLLQLLQPYQAVLHIFGLENERALLNTFQQYANAVQLPVVDWLGKMKLVELPYYMSQMQLYISSDTGNSYIADASGTAVISFMGPCEPLEQRPLGKQVLIIKEETLPTLAYVFKAPYTIDGDITAYYQISPTQSQQISDFLAQIHTVAQSSAL